MKMIGHDHFGRNVFGPEIIDQIWNSPCEMGRKRLCCGFQLRYDRLDRHRRLYCTAGRGCTGTVSECRNRHAGGCL